jgi:hypothetical protein
MEELAGLFLDEDSLKKTWEGVIRTIATDEFATVFMQWFVCCEKCIIIDGRYAEKS